MNDILKKLFGLLLLFSMLGCDHITDDGATSPENIIGVGPTADAGENQTILLGNNIVFDGGNSNDPDAPNEDLSYTWDLGLLGTLTGEVVESTIPINFPLGTYTITLIVTDREGNRAIDTMDITVEVPPPPPIPTPATTTPEPVSENSAPVANDISFLQVSGCTPDALNIVLDGTDTDGDTLVYSIVAQPVSGMVTVSGNIATYTNTTGCSLAGTDLPLIEGTFTYKVNDGELDSRVATVSISFSGVQ